MMKPSAQLRSWFLLVLLFLPGCIPKGGDDPSQFDCSTGNSMYQTIMDNHEMWIEEFYGRDSITQSSYRFLNVALYGPSGYSTEFIHNHDKWDAIDKLLMVRTANDNDFDAAYFGRGGSFGFIYSEHIDPAAIFQEYTITQLTPSVYCYVIKPEYIQPGN